MSLLILRASLLCECHKDDGDDVTVVQGAPEAKLGHLMRLVRGHREVEHLGCIIDTPTFDGLDPTCSTVGGEISVRELGYGQDGGRGGQRGHWLRGRWRGGANVFASSTALPTTHSVGESRHGSVAGVELTGVGRNDKGANNMRRGRGRISAGIHRVIQVRDRDQNQGFDLQSAENIMGKMDSIPQIYIAQESTTPPCCRV